MEDKNIVKLWAVSCITVLASVAMISGHNNVVLLTAIGAILGIAGTKLLNKVVTDGV